MSSHAEKSDYLVVLGSHLLDYADVTLQWRFAARDRLKKLVPIHPDILADQNASDLIAEKVIARQV